MRKHWFILALLLAFSGILEAQHNNIWYFGRKAGLNFNQPVPAPLVNSAMNADEGSSTICDSDGNLLFYTNGVTVFNRNHQIMLNGENLAGHVSTTQSGLIVPRPGSPNLYYIFTADAFENNFQYGYNYSVVDMTRDNGNGEVTTKNVMFSASCTERMTAIRHADGISVWVITNDRSSNIFRSWLINCNGINTTPVVSTLGSILNTYDLMNVGMLKASPDGKQLCQTHFPLFDEDHTIPNFFQLFDFDNATGTISNARTVNFGDAQITGCEFSPNSSLLYLTRPYDHAIEQVEGKLPSPADIVASRFTINTPGSGFFGIQLAPDQKIYLAQPSFFLGAINNPNAKGANCNFQNQQINIAQGSNAFVYAGLPTFLNDLSYSGTHDIGTVILDSCAGRVQFTGISSVPGAATWEWDFGDGSTGTGPSPVHAYSSAQPYYTVKVRIVPSNGCGYLERSKIIYPNGILLNPDFEFTMACESRFVSFKNVSEVLPDTALVRYTWNFGDGNSSTELNPDHTFDSRQIFNVTLKIESGSACTDRSVTKAIHLEPFNIQAPPDRVINPGESVQLTTSGAGATFSWSPITNLSDPTIGDPIASPVFSTTYVVTATNDAGCKDSDTVFIKVKQLPGIYVPSAFSPNNDGRNDIFRPILSDEFLLKEFIIYNRWGQVIFRTSETGSGWDGKAKGLPQSSGVYVWFVTATDLRTGSKEEKKGTFTLVR
jgi:gliding motility-associated-like protein